MSKLFPNYTIDLDNGTVYSNSKNRYIGTKRKDGYVHCKCYDSFGNEYHFIHLVIMAEYLQTPITGFPVDENGKRFEVDHIIPVLKGGTDSISNLRLVSALDNARNENTILNRKLITLGEGNPFYGKHHSEEAKTKMSISRKGKPSPRKGVILSGETKEKLRLSHLGKPSAAAKLVDQIDPITGEVIKTWNSASEAEKVGGYSSKQISKCCHNFSRTHCNCLWRHIML